MPVSDVGVCAECQTLLQRNKNNLEEKLLKYTLIYGWKSPYMFEFK